MKIVMFIMLGVLILSLVLLFFISREVHDSLTENKELKKEIAEKKRELFSIQQIEEEKKKNISSLSQNLQSLQENITNALETDKQISQEAFNNYLKVLEQDYKKAEAEWDDRTQTLTDSYANLQELLKNETEEYKQRLDRLKETHTATIQALVREKEIEEKLSFYCLQISDKELADVKALEEVKIKLNNERILCMLIWQTFFQKPMNTLCANVLGVGTKCGIYKITNLKTKECYIGQAINIADRWKQHAKCGLGIDTPAGNKLYKAIKEYGIWNFSWELIEECPSPQLNEKEKFYISLYDSYNYGYNSNRGNG